MFVLRRADLSVWRDLPGFLKVNGVDEDGNKEYVGVDDLLEKIGVACVHPEQWSKELIYMQSNSWGLEYRDGGAEKAFLSARWALSVLE